MDEIAKTELYLFIKNDGRLYRQRHLPIIKNLVNKKKRHAYSSQKALKSFIFLANLGAKEYAREYARPGEWNTIFSVKTRKATAIELRDDFEREYKINQFKSL